MVANVHSNNRLSSKDPNALVLHIYQVISDGHVLVVVVSHPNLALRLRITTFADLPPMHPTTSLRPSPTRSSPCLHTQLSCSWQSNRHGEDMHSLNSWSAIASLKTHPMRWQRRALHGALARVSPRIQADHPSTWSLMNNSRLHFRVELCSGYVQHRNLPMPMAFTLCTPLLRV